jgi:hypothetical protein
VRVVTRPITADEALCDIDSTDARVQHIVEVLRKSGKSDSEIKDLLEQVRFSPAWIAEYFETGWRSLTQEERCKCVKSIKDACHELNSSLLKLGGVTELPITDDPNQNIARFLRNLYPETFYFGSTYRDPPREYYPLLLLADEAEHWPTRFRALIKRDDDFRQRRALIRKIAWLLRRIKIKRWATLTSELVAVLTGDEKLAENQVRDLVNDLSQRSTQHRLPY